MAAGAAATAAEFTALASFTKSSKFAHSSPPRCAVSTWSSTPRSTARLQLFKRRSSNYGALPSAGSCQWRILASREEIPSEILEDSKFVPITDEDPRFGLAAILLLGFTKEEAVKVQDLLKEMEGDFMQVLLCTEEMARGTLGKALDAVQPNLMEVQVAKGLPRISFLSGLTGEEIMMLIQIFPQAGLESTVFAAHVPLNSDKSMKELMEEIMDDHRRLRQVSASSQYVDELGQKLCGITLYKSIGKEKVSRFSNRNTRTVKRLISHDRTSITFLVPTLFYPLESRYYFFAH